MLAAPHRPVALEIGEQVAEPVDHVVRAEPTVRLRIGRIVTAELGEQAAQPFDDLLVGHVARLRAFHPCPSELGRRC